MRYAHSLSYNRDLGSAATSESLGLGNYRLLQMHLHFVRGAIDFLRQYWTDFLESSRAILFMSLHGVHRAALGDTKVNSWYRRFSFSNIILHQIWMRDSLFQFHTFVKSMWVYPTSSDLLNASSPSSQTRIMLSMKYSGASHAPLNRIFTFYANSYC